MLAAAFAPAAFAHSVLIGTEPANDDVVGEAPDRVSLSFNESVEMSLGGIRVFDGQGNRVDSEDVAPSAGRKHRECGHGIKWMFLIWAGSGVSLVRVHGHRARARARRGARAQP